MRVGKRSVYVVAAAAMIAALVACSATDSASPEPTPSGADPRGEPGAGAPVETRTVTSRGVEIEVSIHPLVALGDHLVFTADLVPVELPDGEERVLVNNTFDGDIWLDGASAEEAGAFRLVDSTAGKIHLAAVDTEGEPAGTDVLSYFSVDADGTRVQRYFAAPGKLESGLGLLMPGWYVEDLPVTEGEVPAPYIPGDEADAERYEEYDPAAIEDEIAGAPILALESYTRLLAGSVEVIESNEKVEVSLAGDVLFASGSHDLSEESAAVLDAAAATLAARGGGVVDIVGHTDDVGDDTSNQALSERRATAVSNALAERVDTASYELRQAGKGESEPLVANSSDHNRQLNRRVTLSLTSEKTMQSEVETEGAVAPFDDGPLNSGAEAIGAEGFDMEAADGHRYHVSAASARRVDGMLVVTVEASRLGDLATQNNEPLLSLWSGVWGYRGDKARVAVGNEIFAPRLLVGSTATYPLDYRLGERDGYAEWRTAGEVRSSDYASGGQTLRFVALYADISDAKTITLDQPYVLGATPYRLSDIPIE